MQYIKEALDKARADRVILPQAVKPAPAEYKPEAARQTGAEAHPLGKIAYRNTTVQPIDPAELARHRVIAAQSFDHRANAFHMLRTQVLRKLREENWNTLAITAATPGAGKSLVAANLAVSMASDINQTVLLVDLDLRRPSIHKYFGVTPAVGLKDYLEGDIDPAALLVNPGIDRLVLLPGRGTAQRSAELLTSPKMFRLAAELRERYDSRYVIYDLPPLLATDDAIAFLPKVECALLVVAKGENTEKEVKESLRLLEVTKLLGTVFNKSDQVVSNYY